MKVLDLTETLKKYKSGWVAIDEKKQKVVSYGKDFAAINRKIKNEKNVFIMSVSSSYRGFITFVI